jgi:hypothetical protein
VSAGAVGVVVLGVVLGVVPGAVLGAVDGIVGAGQLGETV